MKRFVKRLLVILLLVTLAVAVWFRWLDELNPEDVKVEVQTQVEILKDKSSTFSFKEEMSQIVSALDHFFSPPDEASTNEDLVVYLPTNLTEEMQTSHEDVGTGEVNVQEAATSEEPSVSVVTNPTQETEAAESPVIDESPMGYPAPVVDSVSNEITLEVVDVVEEPDEIQPPSSEVSSQEEVDFNQLQETLPGSFLPYNLQSIEPVYTTNFVYPEAGCDWMGVAGQIFGDDQDPQNDLVVVVEGAVNNNMVEVLGYSGLAQAYGPGGYELKLSQVNKPGLFWIQLFDQQGNPLSDIYSFQMDGTCEQNLAIINFSIKTEVASKFVPTVNP